MLLALKQTWSSRGSDPPAFRASEKSNDSVSFKFSYFTLGFEFLSQFPLLILKKKIQIFDLDCLSIGFSNFLLVSGCDRGFTVKLILVIYLFPFVFELLSMDSFFFSHCVFTLFVSYALCQSA